MTQTDTTPGWPVQIALCEEFVATWFETMLAATDLYFRFCLAPFAPPLEDTIEEPGDLDIPGPLERDHEHHLFA
jgi:hypothetical protein